MAWDPERPMYCWREMTPQQRVEVMRDRRTHRLPWHSPPHYEADTAHYLVTAACYEHCPVLGASKERMAEFERELVDVAASRVPQLFGWIVLPNHYHLLVHASSVKVLLKALGQLHGRSSYPGTAPTTGEAVRCGTTLPKRRSNRNGTSGRR
jgi:putative transposase